MANEIRTLTVDGTDYPLPKRWSAREVDELMYEFKSTRDDYVHVTLDDGVAHILVRATTQVSFVLRTPAPARQIPARIR